MQYKQQLIRTEKMSLLEKHVYPWNIKSEKKIERTMQLNSSPISKRKIKCEKNSYNIFDLHIPLGNIIIKISKDCSTSVIPDFFLTYFLKGIINWVVFKKLAPLKCSAPLRSQVKEHHRFAAR